MMRTRASIPLHRAELCMDCNAISDGQPCASCGGRGQHPLILLLNKGVSGTDADSVLRAETFMRCNRPPQGES